MTAAVLCDRCGQPIPTLTESRVFMQQDEFGRCTAMGVAHGPCVAALRQELERGSARDREAVVVDQAGEAFLDVGRVRSLRATARVHTASASRVLAKLKQLWLGELGRPPARRMGARP
jgi:hypothetical protein